MILLQSLFLSCKYTARRLFYACIAGMRVSLKRLDKIFRLCFWAAIVFLVFLAGAFSAHFDWALNDLIRDAKEAGTAFHKKEKDIKKAEARERKNKIQFQEREVLKKKGAYEGFARYSSKAIGAALVYMDGKMVHQWYNPFSKIWTNAPQVDRPMPDSQILWRDAYLYPNGDLLVVHEGVGDTPYGYGLAKLDKDSNVLWHFDENAHHRMDVGPDGKLYVLTQSMVKTDPKSKRGFLPSEVLEDFLVILTPDGKTLEKISLVDAFLGTPYEPLLKKRHRGKSFDVLHTNSVNVLTPETAKAFPQFKAGQVLLSFHTPSAIAVLDLDSRSIVWLAQGSWKLQHDAEFVDDGTIMMFDNQGAGNKMSRILKYDPADQSVKVAYQGNDEHPFYIVVRGMQQLLPNNNILITEAGKGRVFEVTPEQKIVWEFINPHQVRNKPLLIVIAKRYKREDVPFLNDEPDQE